MLRTLERQRNRLQTRGCLEHTERPECSRNSACGCGRLGHDRVRVSLVARLLDSERRQPIAAFSGDRIPEEARGLRLVAKRLLVVRSRSAAELDSGARTRSEREEAWRFCFRATRDPRRSRRCSPPVECRCGMPSPINALELARWAVAALAAERCTTCTRARVRSVLTVRRSGSCGRGCQDRRRV